MKTYITTERTNLFEPNDTISMKFSIIGKIEPQKIVNAFAAAVKANESLNSKIVLSNDGSAWYEPCEEQHNHMLIMQKSWQEVLIEQQKILFQIEKGELLRGFFFPGEKQSEILLLANHLAGDGKSIVYFVEQMMRALNYEELPFRKLRTISTDGILGKEKIPLLVKCYIKYCNSRWKTYGDHFSMEDRRKIHHIYWKKNNIGLCNEHFSQEELERLIAKAKCAKVSLTAYLMAAFNKEVPREITTGLAIDVRSDYNRNMGNQTSGTAVTYRYNNKKSIIENARCIYKKLQKKLSKNVSRYLALYFIGKLSGTLVDSIYMYLSGCYQNPISKKLAKVCCFQEYSSDFSLTNLTTLDIPDHYGNYEINNFVFIPPHISYGKRLIGVATLNHEMNITYQVKENEYIELELEKFKKVMEELKR